MTSKLASMFLPGEGNKDGESPSSGTLQATWLTRSSTDASTAHSDGAPSNVRFANDVQEIEPAEKIRRPTVASDEEGKDYDDLTPQAKEEIKNLAMTLQKSRLQESRMANFTYEPVSLPASRVSDTAMPRFQGPHTDLWKT